MTHAVASAPNDRLHALDALRGGALLLGVVLHAVLAYLPTPIWLFQDADRSPVAAVLFFVVHAFRMVVFFLLAGLFADAILKRRGTAGFIRDRLARIAGPMVGAWWLAFPAVIAVIVWKAALDNGGSIPTDGPPPPPLTAATFPLLHLWFLWVLLIFYALLLPLRAAVRSLGARAVRLIEEAAERIVGPWTPVLLGAPLAAALFLTPDWIPFLGIPTPDAGFAPNPAALTAFGSAFLLGCLINRRRDLLTRVERLWPLFLTGAAGALAAALVVAGGPSAPMAPVADPALKISAAASYAFAVWTTAFAALSLSLRFLSGFSVLRRYLADASYWTYLVHLPLVMAAQVLLLGVDMPWWLKLASSVAGVMTVCLISYELLVRHSFIGRALNGRRIPWRGAPSANALPAE